MRREMRARICACYAQRKVRISIAPLLIRNAGGMREKSIGGSSAAVERASALLAPYDTSIVEYTSQADAATIPGHYVVYWELMVREGGAWPASINQYKAPRCVSFGPILGGAA
ncbi:hypothetical protein GUJ93_ZPchr0008g14112 [Zizania palustris]|uniref:GH3 C-terminal domain-containing protein n=1 Tax=Zizania palustris TaxID=103762 RepID=A0A8J5QZC5_ZIZPA|nr:hypothetical protein GUJ93_ZPchr0008g14112 [Zizania palustris]